jgi:hypothetical protein
MTRTIKALLWLVPLLAVHSVAHAACPDPVLYGAIVNDGLDDTSAIVSALQANDCIELGSGDYEVTKHGTQSILVPSGKTIRGIGAASRIVMIGSGNMSTWAGLRITGPNVSLVDFSITVDPSVINTEQQTHAIEAAGGTVDFVVDRLRLSNPVRPGWAGGDCLRISGELSAPTRRAIVRGSIFQDCDRSAIQLQRETYGIIIQGNHFLDTGDQDIDAELTGTGMAADWLILGNVFEGGSQGNYAVTVHSATGMIKGVSVTGNIFRGRGFFSFNVEGLALIGNSIDNVALNGEPTVWISQACTGCVISGNTVKRTGTVGVVMGLLDHGTGIVRDSVVSGNLLSQQTAASAMRFRGCRGLSVVNNRVTGTAVAYALNTELSNNGAADILVDNNTFSGAWTGFVTGTASSSITQQVVGNRMVQ